MVKRYDVFTQDLYPSQDGEFVSFEDYADLQQKLDELAAEREKFAVECAAAKIAIQYANNAGFKCLLNTPDVDAYLNSVRAEGAELCVKALVTSDDDDFTDAPNVCASVAAQLRSGKDGE